MLDAIALASHAHHTSASEGAYAQAALESAAVLLGSALNQLGR